MHVYHIHVCLCVKTVATITLSIIQKHAVSQLNIVINPSLFLSSHAFNNLHLHGFCDAEIDELESPTNKDKVCRLQVPVNNLALMDCVYGFQHLDRVKENYPRSDRVCQ